jgi:hypothetical protein
MKNLFKKISFKIYLSIPFKEIHPSREPIDIIIPLINKDLGILPLCLEGIRNCVTNTIQDIYIISPLDDEIKNFCIKFNLNFIDEKEVLSYSPNDLNLNNMDRSGWIYQQLLKLSGNFGTCRNYLTIDADHILIQPHTFLAENGKTVFYKSLEGRKSYNENIKKLMRVDLKNISMYSFISHKMLFDKFKIAELQKQIRDINSVKSWDNAIINSIDTSEGACFSEFELYGNFVSNGYSLNRPWKNINLKYSELLTYEDLKKKYNKIYRTITFPAWNN